MAASALGGDDLVLALEREREKTRRLEEELKHARQEIGALRSLNETLHAQQGKAAQALEASMKDLGLSAAPASGAPMLRMALQRQQQQHHHQQHQQHQQLLLQQQHQQLVLQHQRQQQQMMMIMMQQHQPPPPPHAHAHQPLPGPTQAHLAPQAPAEVTPAQPLPTHPSAQLPAGLPQPQPQGFAVEPASESDSETSASEEEHEAREDTEEEEADGERRRQAAFVPAVSAPVSTPAPTAAPPKRKSKPKSKKKKERALEEREQRRRAKEEKRLRKQQDKDARRQQLERREQQRQAEMSGAAFVHTNATSSASCSGFNFSQRPTSSGAAPGPSTQSHGTRFEGFGNAPVDHAAGNGAATDKVADMLGSAKGAFGSLRGGARRLGSSGFPSSSSNQLL